MKHYAFPRSERLAGFIRPAFLAAAFLVSSAAASAKSIYTPYLISTQAGSGLAGSANGTGVAAAFSKPYGVAVDAAGNVYVADSVNDTIRKIIPEPAGPVGSSSSGLTYTGGGIVTTLAGSPGTPGSADGTGSAALFNNPTYLAVDEVGDIYVADTGNNTIRKVTQAGVVTTVAGLPGVVGSADGTGRAALFNAPAGVAVDSVDNIYVADAKNYTIRKITPGTGPTVTLGSSVYAPGGVVTTVAGLPGSPGSADGTGSAALFQGPAGVAVDSGRNLYVADAYNCTIRMIAPGSGGAVTIGSSVYAPGGVVSTLAGSPGFSNIGSADGIGPAAQFWIPQGVAVDSAQNVYVADCYNGLIRKIAQGGSTTTLAGTPASPQPPTGRGFADGAGSAALFNFPEGIAVDAHGTIYIGDSWNNLIRSGILITPPTITSQPAASTVTVGATVTLSVGATSTGPLTYQWFLNGTAIAGATGANLSIPNAQFSNAGSYTVVVTSAAGSVTSAAAAVAVNAFATPSSGGMGGAPSYWFYAALASIAAFRFMIRKRRAADAV